MKIYGRVLKVNEKVTGQSAAGDWVRQEVIIAQQDSDGTILAVTFFGERRTKNLDSLPLNALVEIDCTVASRFYQDRYYTECRGSRIGLLQADLNFGDGKGETTGLPPAPEPAPVELPADDLPY